MYAINDEICSCGYFVMKPELLSYFTAAFGCSDPKELISVKFRGAGTLPWKVGVVLSNFDVPIYMP